MPEWDDDNDDLDDNNTGVATETKQKVEKPPLFKVLLHNDDYTTMEFVVKVLKAVFHKDDDAAMRIMLAVHHAGIGVAGVYTYEIAEAKVGRVTEMARADGFPLLCTVEQD
ncbi:MAG TPA: ATP-dependent Clp protease adapter ClpS [Candidatus Obscuribacterales bacterium]